MRLIVVILGLFCLYPIVHKVGVSLRVGLIRHFAPQPIPLQEGLVADLSQYTALDTKAKQNHSQHPLLFSDQKAFLKQRELDHADLSDMCRQTKIAKVFFYDFVPWSHQAWVNVGKEEGIQPNSPVTVGGVVVGVIEEVKDHQSQMRLITDPKLIIAARLAQGKWKDRFLWSQFLALSYHCSLYEEYQHNASLLKKLAREVESTLSVCPSKLTAKGLVKGSSSLLYKGACVLEGKEFQCEKADEESPSLSLSSLVIQNGDLLVTSGLDGIFPPGLFLGLVSKVNQKDFSYDLSISSCAGDLSLLEYVTILPPVSVKAYDP